jgi:SP family sugar:H+ symporter-like MFS transporter
MSEKAISTKSSGTGDHAQVPALPSADVFDDNSKVPFMTFRTFSMTVVVSLGGILFGYDTGMSAARHAL